MRSSLIKGTGTWEKWKKGEVDSREKESRHTIRRPVHSTSGRHAPKGSILTPYESLRKHLEDYEDFCTRYAGSYRGYEQFDVYRENKENPSGSVIKREGDLL